MEKCKTLRAYTNDELAKIGASIPYKNVYSKKNGKALSGRWNDGKDWMLQTFNEQGNVLTYVDSDGHRIKRTYDSSGTIEMSWATTKNCNTSKKNIRKRGR